jgi:hypothetical protein
MKTAPANFKDFACRTREDVREYNYVASGCSSATSAVPCAATTRLRPHALYVDLTVRRDYPSPAARALRRPHRAPRLPVSGRTRSTSTLPCAASTRLPAAVALHHLRRASGCLGSSHGSSRGSSRRSLSTTPPRACSSSTTSPPPRVRVPRHVAWLVTRLITPLIVDYSGLFVDYSASCRLVVDYFASAARPGASARRVARRVARRATRRRLLRLRRASGCLGTSRGLSRGFVVDYSVRRNFLLRPHWLYFSHAVRRDYLSRGNTGSTSSTPHTATTSSYGRIALTIHLD